MIKSKSRELFILLTCSLTLSLLPFMLHGAPFFNDAWEHMGKARIYAKMGKMLWGPEVDLSSKFFLVNLLIYLFITIPGLPLMQASQIIPFLAALSILPFFLTLTRLSCRKPIALLCSLMLTLESFHMIMTASVAKVTTALYPLMTSLLMLTVLLSSPRPTNLITLILVSLGILFAHHYVSLFFSIMTTIAAIFTIIGWLKKEITTEITILTCLFATAFASALLTYVLLLKAVPEFIYYEDIALLLACMTVASLVIRIRAPPRYLLILTPALIPITLTIIIAVRGEVYAMSLLPFKVHPYEILGYVALIFIGILGGSFIDFSPKNILARAYVGSAITMLAFSFLYGFFYIGIVLLLKAIYLSTPAILLWISTALNNIENKHLHRMTLALLILSATSIPTLGIRCTILEDPSVSGLVSYHRGEYEQLKNITPLIANKTMYGDSLPWCISMVLDNVKISPISPYSKLSDGICIIALKKSWNNRLFEAGYEWYDPGLVIKEPFNRVLDGNYLLALEVIA